MKQNLQQKIKLAKSKGGGNDKCIYYSMSKRAIRKNIQLSSFCIGPSVVRANTEARELNIFPYCPTIASAIIDLLYDF